MNKRKYTTTQKERDIWFGECGARLSLALIDIGDRDELDKAGKGYRKNLEHQADCAGDLQAELHQLRADNKRLRAGLIDAATALADWGGYASQHHKEKWDLTGDIARIRAYAKEPPHA